MAKIKSIAPYRGVHHEITFTDVNPDDIFFKHFSGKADQFHIEGARDFQIRVDEGDVEDLKNCGINVKKWESNKGDILYSIKVKASWRFAAPSVALVDGKDVEELTESDIDCLDQAEIIAIHEFAVTTSKANDRPGPYSGLKPVYLKEAIFEQRHSDFRAKLAALTGRDIGNDDDPGYPTEDDPDEALPF